MRYDNRPIGLIDSGIGGFTVLKECQQQLPKESLIYLGDSERMPYGELTNDEIIAFANSDIRFLESHGVKAILLACNTVSSLIDQLTSTVPLFSIVEAGCKATIEMKKNGVVGLIATRATVNNNAYPRLLATMTDQIQFLQHGTSTLAAVINNYPEEIEMLKGHIKDAIDPLIHEAEIEELLLGCTHYPIVRETIAAMYPRLTLINPAVKQIESLSQYLEAHDAFHEAGKASRTEIFTTGTMADYGIFKNMIRYLRIDCDNLQRCKLDIDKV